MRGAVSCVGRGEEVDPHQGGEEGSRGDVRVPQDATKVSRSSRYHACRLGAVHSFFVVTRVPISFELRSDGPRWYSHLLQRDEAMSSINPLITSV